MDYFQGVVNDYLRATRTQFVNTEYMINLDPDGTYKRGRHWYCDAVAIDFAARSVHLCEISYSKTLHTLGARLQSWASHWPELAESIRRDSALTGEWHIAPRVFVPEQSLPLLSKIAAAIKRPEGCAEPMPAPIATSLTLVMPWNYRSWNGKSYSEDGTQSPVVPEPLR